MVTFKFKIYSIPYQFTIALWKYPCYEIQFIRALALGFIYPILLSKRLSMQRHFLSLSVEDFQILMKELGQPTFRAKQIIEWIYLKKVSSPDEMSNIPQKLRENLKEHLDFFLPKIVSTQESKDQTTKILFETKSQEQFETVIIRYADRTSLCVSTQLGCKLGCKFCMTGKMGFKRNLKSEEILSQFLIANQIVRAEERSISHVVFMGMGEPLDNFENVVCAANTLIDENLFNLSSRRVTISTAGLVPGIKKLANASKAALAVSLNAPTDALRSEIMPINKKYPLAELKQALQHYQRVTDKRVTFEYILIKGKNSDIASAKKLVHFLHGIKAKINLIPFNPHPDLDFKPPGDSEIRAFQQYLSDRSIPAPVRYSKGLDVAAACGHLATKSKPN